MIDEIMIEWDCPDCHCKNTDDFIQTAVPLCAGCDKDFYWGDVLDLKRLEKANAKLKAYLDGGLGIFGE